MSFRKFIPYVIVYLIGGYLITIATLDIIRSYQPMVSTTATVEDHKVFKRKKARSRKVGHFMASIGVKYSYQVGTKSYTGFDIVDRISYQPRDRWVETEINKVIQKFPVGSGIKIYYHTDRPNKSYLEDRNLSGWVWVGLVVGFWICLFSTLSLKRRFGILNPKKPNKSRR